MTYYNLLEISETASEEVIRVAYRALAKKYHPDVYKGEPSFAQQQMKQINEAYDVLSNPGKRAEYDKTLKQKKHYTTNSGTTEKQTNYYSSSSDKETSDKHHTSKVPLLFKWKTIFLGLMTASIFENKAFFYTCLVIFALRFFAGIGNKGYRLHGLKKIIAFCCCGFALVVSLSVFSSDYNTTIPSSTHSSQHEIVTTETNTPDNIETQPEPDVQNQEQSENIVCEPPKFSKPTILDDTYIEQVWSIENNQALLSVNEDNDIISKSYDLESGKEVTDNSLIGFLGLLSGNMYYNFESGKTFVYDESNDNLENMDSNIAVIDTILSERNAYVIKRTITDVEYSGLEYALISFDGTMLTEWIHDSASIEPWSHIGDGMYTTGHLVDMLNGELSDWPTIEYIEYLNEGEYVQSYLDHSDFFLRGQSEFRGEDCIAYLQRAKYGHSPLVFYSINRLGQYQEISRVPSADHVEYIEDLEMYVCVSYNEDMSYYNDFIVYDMFGNILLNLQDSKITHYSLGDSYITISQENKDGFIQNTFFSFYNYHGQEIHAPFSATEKDVILLETFDSYALLGDNTVQIYDMNDTFLFEIEPIKTKERALIGKKDRTYYPTNIWAYDGYYVIRGVEPDIEQVRYFIGKVEYTKPPNIPSN